MLVCVCVGVCVCVCVCVCVRVCVCVCVCDNSKHKVSIYLKLEHIIVYGNCFDIGHCMIKVKLKARLKFISIYHNELSDATSTKL